METPQMHGNARVSKDRQMNTKLLVFCAWMFLLALRQTADEFWLFCLIYASVLATCTFFFRLENKSLLSSRKKKKR
jgi:hypothetical protein